MFNEYSIISLFLGFLFILLIIVCLIYNNNNEKYICKDKNEKFLII